MQGPVHAAAGHLLGRGERPDRCPGLGGGRRDGHPLQEEAGGQRAYRPRHHGHGNAPDLGGGAGGGPLLAQPALWPGGGAPLYTGLLPARRAQVPREDQ